MIHVERIDSTFLVYPDSPDKSEHGKPALSVRAPLDFTSEIAARKWFSKNWSVTVVWIDPKKGFTNV